MNNRVQQRFDRSIREAVEATRRARNLRHAEQQAHAEEAGRNAPRVAPKPKPPTRRLSQADQLRAYEAAPKCGACGTVLIGSCQNEGFCAPCQERRDAEATR